MTTVNFNLDNYHIWEHFISYPGTNSWITLRDYADTAELQTEATGYFTRVESYEAHKLAALSRSFMRFTVAGIPAGATITSASLHCYQLNNTYTFPNGTPSIAVGFYNRNADIPNTDFHDCMSTILSTYARGNDNEWQVYTITPALIQNGYMQFVLRDGAFDYPNTAPTVNAQLYNNVGFDVVTNAPYLEVVYSTIPSPKLVGSNLNGGAYRVSRRLL